LHAHTHNFGNPCADNRSCAYRGDPAFTDVRDLSASGPSEARSPRAEGLALSCSVAFSELARSVTLIGRTDPAVSVRDGRLAAMTAELAKADLRRDLQAGRDAVLWKLAGLGEYDVRRPMTPTGTNLLGLVKHLTFVELGYFGVVFGRPVAAAQAWIDDEGEPNWDMWAAAGEPRAAVEEGYRSAWAHADATIEALALDAPGEVSWWRPATRAVTLHQVLVHVVAETHRHAGHADVVRELVDGSAGLRAGGSNLPDGDAAWWAAYRERLERAAQEARGS
jgi:hypothetical protein